MDTLHEQVRIEHGDMSAEVDVGIAPLILTLWKRGFRTVASDERDPDTAVAYVAFESDEQAQIFARVARGRFTRVTGEDRDAVLAGGTPVEEAEAFGTVGTPVVFFEPNTISEVRRRVGQMRRMNEED
jgi:hypothetical protein